jgi:hypothetical protein
MPGLAGPALDAIGDVAVHDLGGLEYLSLGGDCIIRPLAWRHALATTSRQTTRTANHCNRWSVHVGATANSEPHGLSQSKLPSARLGRLAPNKEANLLVFEIQRDGLPTARRLLDGEGQRGTIPGLTRRSRNFKIRISKSETSSKSEEESSKVL